MALSRVVNGLLFSDSEEAIVDDVERVRRRIEHAQLILEWTRLIGGPGLCRDMLRKQRY